MALDAASQAEGEAWEARQLSPFFHRTDDRRSRRTRTLDCGHRIDPTEPYRYAVWKDRGAARLSQLTTCDVCRREDHAY